jgi:hypothetical protein
MKKIILAAALAAVASPAFAMEGHDHAAVATEAATAVAAVAVEVSATEVSATEVSTTEVTTESTTEMVDEMAPTAEEPMAE